VTVTSEKAIHDLVPDFSDACSCSDERKVAILLGRGWHRCSLLALAPMVGAATLSRDRSSVTTVLVAGIDVWRKRWTAVVLCDGRYERALIDPSLGKLLEALPGVAAIGIDMPFGLTSGARRREADAAAREFVGPRGSAVFPTYPREVYEAPNYDAARETCLKLTEGSISRQAYALGERILELERTVEGQHEVREVHPEVSFREMAGRFVSWPKTSWNGLHERKQLLLDHGVEIPTQIATIGNAGAEDVLDAAAAAWSADRIAHGAAKTFPDPPQVANGRQIAIWY